MECLETELKGNMTHLDTEFKGDTGRIEAELKGIGKHLDTQDFINCSVVIGLVLTVLAGVLRILLPELYS